MEKLEKLAIRIHGEVCGCDDKTCTLATEIWDWLENGDAASIAEATLAQLCAEWAEYNAAPEEE